MLDDHADRDLALHAHAGQTQAFGVLVERYQTSVFQVCYRLMGERQTAEDMTQEAFIRAYQRLQTFDPALPFGPWVRRVAANVCLNALERKQRVVFSLDEDWDRYEAEWLADTADPARVFDDKDTHAAIRSAILSLPPRYRVVIELCHMQELSYAEAAAALALPMSAIKSHLFRARQMLAKRLHPLRPGADSAMT